MTKITCLGPEATNSWLATQRFARLLSADAVGIDVGWERSHSQVCRAVMEHRADLGVLAIESRHEGAVLGSLRDFRKTRLSIFAELEVPIFHYFLGLPGAAVGQIKEVRSHYQAFTQCSQWWSLNNWKPIYSPSTSEACEEVIAQSNVSVAAIASEEAGIRFGLRKLQEESVSNTEPGPTTRFWVVTRGVSGMAVPIPEIDKKNQYYRTTFYLQVNNEPAALARVLMKLSQRNMLWIQTFFHRESDTPPNWDYHFFLTYEGGGSDEPGVMEKGLEDLYLELTESPLVREFLPLGTYPVLKNELLRVTLPEELIRQ